MNRTPFAAAAALGSTALVVAALTTPVPASAEPEHPAAAPPAATTAVAGVYPPSSKVITKVKKHGVWTTSFSMVRSSASISANCLPKAKARVSIKARGEVEEMKVSVKGLPKRTTFDFFVLQAPDFPFAMSWYQGDLKTDKHGKGDVTYVGRFNKETFTIAPGVAPAPAPHPGDSAVSPGTPPIHQYHLGFWFDDPADAVQAGCSPNVTPFNGEHDAGVQALSTAQFPQLGGPLKHVRS